MQDGIIKETGNSRYLKSISNFLTQYPTYQDFVAALVAGTLPIDLNGINETGWDQLGTALNKANLLSDETAAAQGFPNTAVPDDVLRECLIIEASTYIGTGTYGRENPTVLNFRNHPIMVMVCAVYNNPGYASSSFVFFHRAAGVQPQAGSSTTTALTTWEDNYVSFYSSNAPGQANAQGVRYVYCALTYNGSHKSILQTPGND